MSERRQRLIDLVMIDNVSAIQILSDRLGITPEEVIELINSTIETGELNGALTQDGKRFFKSAVKLSDAPKIEREDSPPDFLGFNTRPGIITSTIGFLVLGGGLIMNALAADENGRNFAAILILFGIFIVITGLYWLSKRKTPA